MIRKKYNLIGQKIGNGTVIRELEIRKVKHNDGFREHQEWELKCDCSALYYALTPYLIGKKPKKSCGCLNHKNLIGRRFGNGVVICFEGYRRRGLNTNRSCPLWNLQCDCGKTYQAISEYLSNKDVSSCGCNKGFKSKYVPTTIEKYFKIIKSHAIKIGREFTVSEEEISDLLTKQNAKCKLSELPISLDTGTASLDRIDNSKGYITGNLQWLHRRINLMKHIISIEEFTQFCCAVADCSRRDAQAF